MTVTFALSDSRISLHEPVLAKLSVRNQLKETVAFDLGFDRTANLDFHAVGPDGQNLSPAPRSESGFGRSGKISLPPGQTYVQNLLLSERFRFEKPGHYRIEARLNQPIRKTGSGETVSAQPQTLDLEIQPSDPARLATVCSRIAGAAVDSQNMGEVLEAARALSYVEDPAALPFLQRVMTEGRTEVKLIAIQGLQRIGSAGNGGAVDVLIQSLEAAPSDVAASARAALAQLRNGVRDRALREKIDRALATARPHN